MKKHIPFLVLVIIVLAIFIFNSRSGIDTNTQYPSVNTDTQNSGVNIDIQWSPAPISEITWETYTSDRWGITFDYPIDWTVKESGVGLSIWPTEDILIVTEKPGLNNVISFFKK